MNDKNLERLQRVIALYAKVSPDLLFDRSRRNSDNLISSRGVRTLFVLSAFKLGYKPSDLARFRGVTQIDTRGIKKIAFGLEGETWHRFARQVLSLFRKKIVYLAGKVSNLDLSQVKTKFKEAEDALTKMGFYVVNPTKILPEGTSWNNAMRTLIPLMMYCDALCMLPDWARSEGAKLEYDIAKRLGMEIFTFDVDSAANKRGFSRWGI